MFKCSVRSKRIRIEVYAHILLQVSYNKNSIIPRIGKSPLENKCKQMKNLKRKMELFTNEAKQTSQRVSSIYKIM